MKEVTKRRNGQAAGTEIIVDDQGQLTITNKRLVFTGQRKPTDYAWSKIITVRGKPRWVQPLHHAASGAIDFPHA